MTHVIYIIGRTDNQPSYHSHQFIRETNELLLDHFVTTGTLNNAKRFKDPKAAMKFLARTMPSNSLQERNFSGFSAFCYEIIIADSVAVSKAMAEGKSPQTLNGGPLAVRLFCATLGAETPPSAP